MKFSALSKVTIFVVILTTGCSFLPVRPIIINHSPPDYGATEAEMLSSFAEMGGCSKDPNSDEYICEAGSPFNAIGCEKLTDIIFPGLDPYPVVECIWKWGEDKVLPDGFNDECNFCDWAIAHVTFDENRFRVIKTNADYKELFFPIESPNEALDFVLATRDRYEVLVFEVQYSQDYQYFADKIESTYAEAIDDRYFVHLLVEDAYGVSDPSTDDCIVTGYAIDYIVMKSGNIEIVGTDNKPMYTYKDEFSCGESIPSPP